MCLNTQETLTTVNLMAFFYLQSVPVLKHTKHKNSSKANTQNIIHHVPLFMTK